MNIRKLILAGLFVGLEPVSGFAGVFPPDSGLILSCSAESGKHYQVDVTLFPNTLRVDGTYLELKSSTDANDGFKVGIYKQTGSSQKVMLAVRQGYRPVFIEDNQTYVCR
ncbi:hypothetical protein [Klebsiella aerogenes]|uniref:hypothetical protein n=1 Tax=Klebsiella aerogenes TaxID=548 RepID=UPI001F1C6848|nr:hypothetical protein [Klebsiella aerogenes]